MTFSFIYRFRPEIKSLLFAMLFLASFQVSANGKIKNHYLKLENEQKIDKLIEQMTLQEKITMLHGSGLFFSGGVERLAIPELKYADGPFEIRQENFRESWNSMKLDTDSATFFPTGSALAASWSEELAYAYGIAIGQEARTRGKDVLLGPAINITRSPLNGRTYEYMSEDPFLNSRLAVGYVKGVQDQGVAACLKHYAANNQETNRGSVNVKMDERALREIYLPAFRAAVEEGGALSVMTAYNKFRGQYLSENDYLVNKILKGEWGFEGFTVSDWGGTHSTVGCALGGLEVEMPSWHKGAFFADSLENAVKNGTVSIDIINEKVRRILRVILYSGEKTTTTNVPTLVSTPEHCKTAYEVAAHSIVLLKNEQNVLPLDIAKIKRIAVIGDNANRKMAQGGIGAGVKARYEISPLEGIQKFVGTKAIINFAQGYEPRYLTGKKGEPGKPVDNSADYELIKAAVDAAKNSDVAIVVVGTNREVETEGIDRRDMEMPFGQNQLIKEVCAVNPRTIVVVVAGAPLNLSDAKIYAPAILYSWFNGTEAGTALADIVFGTVNPSGKLPLTFPASLFDSPAHALKAFPGDTVVTYHEGILVGYRWFENKNYEPLYSFGYGLSYTNFTYTDFKSDKANFATNDNIVLKVKLKNTGNRDGYEVIQIYSGEENPSVLRPVKELKAFKKVFLKTGEEKEVAFEIKAVDLGFFDEKQMQWAVNGGSYKLFVAASSNDIKGSIKINILK